MPKITFTPPGHAPLKYRLDKEVVKVGRGEDCDAHIAFGGVSNHHAEMRQTRTGYVVFDLGSTNGIKLEGELVKQIELEHGSKFAVGDVEALFELYPEEQETVEAGDDLFEGAPSAEEVIEKVMLTRQPSKEFATVEQMGGTVVFLCSDAARFMNGEIVSVDGHTETLRTEFPDDDRVSGVDF